MINNALAFLGGYLIGLMFCGYVAIDWLIKSSNLNFKKSINVLLTAIGISATTFSLPLTLKQVEHLLTTSMSILMLLGFLISFIIGFALIQKFNDLNNQKSHG